MQPGATIIKECPECFRHIEQATIASGNTFGAVCWTDGKRDTPMLPDQPRLVMCPHCDAPIWLDELEELDRIEPWGRPRGDFEDDEEAKPYKWPTQADYFRLLDQGLDGAGKEPYVRLRAWWAGNDDRRHNIDLPLSRSETANLLALAALMDESNDNDRLMKAEIMRELGRFDDAASLLAEPFDDPLSQAAAIIQRLVDEQDHQVRELVLD